MLLGNVLELVEGEEVLRSSQKNISPRFGAMSASRYTRWWGYKGGLYLTNQRLVWVPAVARWATSRSGKQSAEGMAVSIPLPEIEWTGRSKRFPLPAVVPFISTVVSPMNLYSFTVGYFGFLAYLPTHRLAVKAGGVEYYFDVGKVDQWVEEIKRAQPV